MKITKLPDAIDPNMIMKKIIEKTYGSKCPFCNEPLTIFSHTSSYWYGKQKDLPFFKRIISKPRHWQQNHYYCMACGAMWDSVAFPRYILDQNEVNKIYEKIMIMEELDEYTRTTNCAGDAREK